MHVFLLIIIILLLLLLYYYCYYLLILVSIMFFIVLEFKQPIHINFTTKFGSHYPKKKHFSCLHHHNSTIPRFLRIPPPTSFRKLLTHPHVPRKTFILHTAHIHAPFLWGKNWNRCHHEFKPIFELNRHNHQFRRMGRVDRHKRRFRLFICYKQGKFKTNDWLTLSISFLFNMLIEVFMCRSVLSVYG